MITECKQNPEGRQLLLEAVALVGALLLALDRRIDGAVRERSVVAYYRLKGGAQVCLAPSPCTLTLLNASTIMLGNACLVCSLSPAPPKCRRSNWRGC